MKKGYHIWPYSGKPHPVGEKHDVKDGKVHGEQTNTIEYRYPKNEYKQGKWEFIRLME